MEESSPNLTGIAWIVSVIMIAIIIIGFVFSSVYVPVRDRANDIVKALETPSASTITPEKTEKPVPSIKPTANEVQTTSMVAALRKGEAEESAERNTVKLDMRNSGYSIMLAVHDGKVKEGTTLEGLKKLVPRAFQANKGTGMAIVYNPDSLGQLSFCGWVKGLGSITEAIIYDARADAFAPTSMNCNGNPYILAESMDLDYKDNLEPVILPANFKFPGSSIAVSDTNKTPVDDPAAPAPVTKATAEPVNIPWGGIIITAFILLGLATLVGLGFGILNLSGRVRKTTQARITNINSWEILVKRFNAVNTKWVNYEIDIVKILDFPLMSDMREKATLDFHDALQKAKTLQPSDLKRVSDVSAIDSPFAAAVDTLESTFRVAESEAQRIRWSNFSVEERKRLKKAKDLLNLAMNEASTENERQSAYKMMQKELDGIILVPKAGILRLEKSINLLLTDGVNS